MIVSLLIFASLLDQNRWATIQFFTDYELFYFHWSRCSYSNSESILDLAIIFTRNIGTCALHDSKSYKVYDNLFLTNGVVKFIYRINIYNFKVDQYNLTRDLLAITSACESLMTSPSELMCECPRHLVPVPNETTFNSAKKAI